MDYTNKKIISKVEEIISVLELKLNYIKEDSLFEGKAGVALFFCLYGKLFNKNDFLSKGQNLLTETIFDNIKESTSINPFFCEGLAGIGWLYEYLCSEKIIDDGTNETLLELDEYLSKTCLIIQDSKNWDFLNGSMGIALYFLKRMDTQPLYKNFLYNYVDSLSKSATIENDKLKWYSIIRNFNEPMEPNISFAHGASGIVSFLSKLKNKGISNDLINKLLTSSVDFILSNEFPNGSGQKSCFPPYSLESKYKIYHSRLSWCYGDLSIAISLWNAGNALNDERLKKKAINVYKSSFERKEFLDNFINDACLCHGSAGISLMSQRMYFNTGDKSFLENINYWINQTMNFASNEDGVCGFRFWSGREDKFINDYSLLGGLTGVGLSLLSYLAFTEEFQSWDECFLLS